VKDKVPDGTLALFLAVSDDPEMLETSAEELYEYIVSEDLMSVIDAVLR